MLLTQPYHLPSQARPLFTNEEVRAVRDAAKSIDEDESGWLPMERLPDLLQALGETSALSRSENFLLGVAQEGLDGSLEFPYKDLMSFLAGVRRERRPFGGKRCIKDFIPLPPCCSNSYCQAHMERPGDAQVDHHQGVLKMIFARHDVDGGGSLTCDELQAMLQEYGVECDEDAVQANFARYDIDGSGSLDVDEFIALMKDLRADVALASKRSGTYDLPPGLRAEFSSEEIEQFLVSFGMFDDSGDGMIDEQELTQLLETFGTAPEPDKVRAIMAEIDYDQSGTIEFSEFVALMKKVRDGEVELDNSAFAQAVMGSATATTLRQEISALEMDSEAQGVAIAGCQELKMVRASPAMCEASLLGPPGSPYEGKMLKLQIEVPDGYPYSAPGVRFKHRVLHLNFDILLNGTTAMPQLLKQWTATWRLRMLLERVYALLQEPDPSLVPRDLLPASQPPPSSSGSKQLARTVAKLFFEDKAAYEALAARLTDGAG